RSSPRARLRLPVAISLLIQVPGALFGWRGPGPRAGSPSFALSADWPLALSISVVACLTLFAARRWPGPVVAFVTAAAIAALRRPRLRDSRGDRPKRPSVGLGLGGSHMGDGAARIPRSGTRSEPGRVLDARGVGGAGHRRGGACPTGARGRLSPRDRATPPDS